MNKWVLGIAIAAAFVAGSIATGTMAFADDDDELIESDVVGLPVSMTAPAMLRGVPGGGLPWVVDEGEIELDSDGELEVEVEGLLITAPGLAPDGTTGPFTEVVASLTCDGIVGAVPGGTTSPAPLSSTGDAEIEDTISIPASCDEPIVLIRGNTPAGPGPWIAASEFFLDDDDDDDDE